MIITDINLLNKECEEASVLEAHDIISKLEYELTNSSQPGVGLAANQIGIDKKVCIIRYGRDKIDLVNPTITDKKDLRLFKNEGCLSFPGKVVSTKRYNEILVKDSLNPEGIVCTGVTAVIVQHECSHLYGETMYDYEVKIPKPNFPCWCGSSKKFKKCHMFKEIVHM